MPDGPHYTDVITQLSNAKDAAARLNLWKTFHAIAAALNAVGWEVADKLPRCKFVHTLYTGPVGRVCGRGEEQHCEDSKSECQTKGCRKEHHPFHRSSKRKPRTKPSTCAR